MAKPVLRKRNWAWTSAFRRILHRTPVNAAFRRKLQDAKKRVVRRAEDSLATGDSLAAKLAELRRAFEGGSELCYMHAELIVRLRRGIDASANWEMFSYMWQEESDFLGANLDSRWLISALDTFADYGDRMQQARALIQIAFFNLIRIAQTERALLGDRAAQSEIAADRQGEKHELWDGIEAYNFRRGDVVWNMLARIRRALEPDPILSRIFETLLQRALRNDTLIGRVARASEHPRRESAESADA